MVGVTPKQYAMERRASRLREQLRKGSTITEAMYDAGFGSSSRFYEKATPTLGMKPSTYKNGAQDVLIRFAVVPCFLGLALVAATGQGICAIDFGDTAEALKEQPPSPFPKGANFRNPDPKFTAMIAEGSRAFWRTLIAVALDLPLDVQGTAFQRRVWLALQEIPAGDTVSYARNRVSCWKTESRESEQLGPVPLIPLLSLFLVTEWCGAMANWAAIAGVWSESGFCSSEKERKTQCRKKPLWHRARC